MLMTLKLSLKPCKDIFNYFSGGFSSTDASKDPKCEVEFDQEGLTDIVISFVIGSLVTGL